MCLLANETATPRARLFLIFGMLSLVLALGSRALDLAFGLSANSLDFLRGFFLGLSIVFNFTAFLTTRRRHPRPS